MCMTALAFFKLFISLYSVSLYASTHNTKTTHTCTHLTHMQEDSDMISHALTDYCFVLIVLKSVCLAHDIQCGL